MNLYRTTLVILAVCAAGCAPNLDARRAEVAEAGRLVMPFDLDATTHSFEKLDAGGVQTVVADTDDPDQIALIRLHLREEAERFARGDFHDPAAIHGGDMPGLHELATDYQKISVTYGEIDRGAEIRYESPDPALVNAIHLWFDAQVSDHGEHAQQHP